MYYDLKTRTYISTAYSCLEPEQKWAMPTLEESYTYYASLCYQ